MAAVNGQMSDADSIEWATRRLLLALDALEAAAERRSEADRGEELLADQIQVLGTDRARLASELDDVTARARVLETANREVMERIDQAIDTIRGVLAADGEAAHGDTASSHLAADELVEDDAAEDESAGDESEENESEEEDSEEDE
jgi:L-lactate utilization protein LutB